MGDKYDDDQTLPNIIKRKHPKKGRDQKKKTMGKNQV